MNGKYNHASFGKSRKWKQGTRQACIDALRRVSWEIGRSPTATKKGKNSYDRFRKDSEPCGGTILNCFDGSWNAALLAAGLKLNDQPASTARENGLGARKFSDDELLVAIRVLNARVNKDKGVLRADDYDKYKLPCEPCSAIIRKRFYAPIGGWAAIRDFALNDYEPETNENIFFSRRILEQVRG